MTLKPAQLLRGCVIVAVLVIAAFSAGLLFLSRNKAVRDQFFASLCNRLTGSQSAEFRSLVCEVLRPLRGRILELGPGTGANWHCFANNSLVESYTGVEPNPHMESFLRDNAAAAGVRFPITVVRNGAESMGDIPSDSVDFVVGTHLLCSVDNAERVLDEALRVLKPGGQYLFVEHVSSHGPVVRWLQDLAAPVWFILGNGCKFEPTDELLERRRAEFAELKYEYLNAPIPLPIVQPHIVGSITKKQQPTAAEAAEAPAAAQTTVSQT